jgi:hypothetical protein
MPLLESNPWSDDSIPIVNLKTGARSRRAIAFTARTDQVIEKVAGDLSWHLCGHRKPSVERLRWVSEHRLVVGGSQSRGN